MSIYKNDPPILRDLKAEARKIIRGWPPCLPGEKKNGVPIYKDPAARDAAVAKLRAVNARIQAFYDGDEP
jgi:hypothetical protein